MIAEIYEKQRLHSEDQLTGDFFGAMRYIEFREGLGKIIKEALNNEDVAWIDNIEKPKYIFWRKDLKHKRTNQKAEDSTEPDVIIEDKEAVILVEVKYLSGPSDDTVNKKTQIERECKFLIDNYNKKQKIFIYLAKEDAFEDLKGQIRKVKQEYPEVKIIQISWQKILEAVKKVKQETEPKSYKYTILDDIYNLLKIKGFEEFKTLIEGVEEIEIDQNHYWKFE